MPHKPDTSRQNPTHFGKISPNLSRKQRDPRRGKSAEPDKTRHISRILPATGASGVTGHPHTPVPAQPPNQQTTPSSASPRLRASAVQNRINTLRTLRSLRL